MTRNLKLFDKSKVYGLELSKELQHWSLKNHAPGPKSFLRSSEDLHIRSSWDLSLLKIFIHFRRKIFSRFFKEKIWKRICKEKRWKSFFSNSFKNLHKFSLKDLLKILWRKDFYEFFFERSHEDYNSSWYLLIIASTMSFISSL